MKDRTYSIDALVRWGAGQLHEAGVEEPLAESRRLLTELLDYSLARQLADGHQLVPDVSCQVFREGIDRRCLHEPLAYISGYKDFLNDRYLVKNCLIPRPESEELVLAAVDLARDLWAPGSELQILDLCAGSGCLGLSCSNILREQGYRTNLYATDISGPSLESLTYNYRTFAYPTDTVFQVDLWPPVDRQFDLVLCNPPYVSPAEYEDLSREVKDYEPQAALLAQDNGLAFYKRLAAGLDRFLAPKSASFLEHGSGQRPALQKIFGAWYSKGRQLLTRDDFAGHDRVLILIKDIE